MFTYEIRHAFRLLVREPGFTFAAVLTLALGVGANVAVFAVIQAVLLRPLPYSDADRLVIVNHRDQRTGITKEFIAIRRLRRPHPPSNSLRGFWRIQQRPGNHLRCGRALPRPRAGGYSRPAGNPPHPSDSGPDSTVARLAPWCCAGYSSGLRSLAKPLRRRSTHMVGRRRHAGRHREAQVRLGIAPRIPLSTQCAYRSDRATHGAAGSACGAEVGLGVCRRAT